MPAFYDAHCHMMNLSHPNLLAMIRRVFRDAMPPRLLSLYGQVVAMPLLPKLLVWMLLFVPALLLLMLASLAALIVALLLMVPRARDILLAKGREKVANILNLLAVMETDIGDCLIQLEEELRANHAGSGGLAIRDANAEMVYDRIVMTPLIMDFGLKNYQDSKSPYKVRWKPVVAQVEDLFSGIRDYHRYRAAYIGPEGAPPPPLFEIHPFMGLNTRNYQLKLFPPVDGPQSFLEDLLDKNFGLFGLDTTPEMRRRKLSERDRSAFDGNIAAIGSHDFAGIKLYPPLGFNPWPEDLAEGYADTDELDRERQKVAYLYAFCIRHNVPITAHCCENGFLVDKRYREYSSPARWEKVLRHQEYRQLRLNLAHFGGVERPDWRDRIAGLVLEYENVYTDISYQGVDRNIYGNLKRFLDRFGPDDRRRLMEKIIFGSDFMINLQDIATYGTYLEYFARTDTFTLDEKDQLCNRNAMRFLFLA